MKKKKNEGEKEEKCVKRRKKLSMRKNTHTKLV